ncbi:hypothetical protein [Pseudomonas syringae]|uniref:hypothetical protein n=1 Tax=Pseudomonas syringae TaxID=317 RepID=UPI00067B5CE5|nr:hypothetical protein [Pseudomonas syringae]
MDTYTYEGSTYYPSEKIGSMTLLLLPGQKKLMAEKRLFECQCGNLKMVRVAHVAKGVTVSCGCVKRKNLVHIGQRSGRLEVIDDQAITVGKSLRVLCRCDCGTEKLVGVFEITKSLTASCGCLVRETASRLNLIHGGEGSRLYTVWHGMKTRCTDPNSQNYHRYGGRGITVCDEWAGDFAVFRSWAIQNGYDDLLQIDRINVDGGYCPENCRFVTPMVNANNRGNNVLLSAFEEIKTMRDWSRDERCAVSYSTLKKRIKAGRFTHEEAITRTARN